MTHATGGEPYSLNDAILGAIAAYMEGVRICLPGEVRKYDPVRRCADVKPLIKRVFVDGQVEPLPVLTAVPVVWPSGAGGGVAFPLQAGDGVLIVFSERNMEDWLSGKGGDSTPKDGRKFDMSDAIAIPGIYPFGVASPFPDDGSAVFTFQGATMKMKGGTVALGTPAAELLDIISSLISAVETLTVICSAPTVASSPPVNIATFTALKVKLSLIKGAL